MMGSGQERTIGEDVDGAFATNLRHLCGFYPSVAHVCRTIGINRTQFNRYLAASGRPSRHMLTRICDFFGVSAAEIHLPPEEFERLQLNARQRKEPSPAPYVGVVEMLQRASRPEMHKYLGYYHEYYYSMSSPGKILRGLVHMFERDGQVYFRKIEHVCGPPGLPVTFKFRYIGAAFFLNDRIFLVDTESLTQNEITEMILFPTFKNKVGRLSGLLLGVSSGDYRRIACSRFVLDWLGTRVNLRNAVKACGVFDPDSGAIDPSVVAAIDNTSPGGPLFYARDF